MSMRLVVLVSGNGSNLQALLDATTAGELDIEVAAVISNEPEAYGLERARRAGAEAIVVTRDGDDRPTYDRRLASVVSRFNPDLVVLAGWMRILTTNFLDGFDVINLHPALPGTFPGVDAIGRAFAAWEADEITQTGAMVHWVPDEGIDVGPVIEQRTVPFVAGESRQAFEERLHQTEHELLVAAVARLVRESTGTTLNGTPA